MELQVISTANIIGMVFSLILSVGLPIILIVVGKKKFNAKISSFFIGCGVFLVMALILEQSLHSIVFLITGDAITGNNWLLALYGGLAAAVFEEVGRLFAFKVLLKKNNTFENAFMYGAGHGGFEAIVIVGITMINNIATSIAINSGSFPNTLELLDEETQAATYGQLAALWTTPAYEFYLGGIERVFAILLQIAFSLIMFEAVKNKKASLIALPFVLHFAVDFVTVAIKPYVPVVVIEIIIAIVAVVVFMLSHKISKKYEVVEAKEE